jgi:hypothetical protein
MGLLTCFKLCLKRSGAKERSQAGRLSPPHCIKKIGVPSLCLMLAPPGSVVMID